METGSDLRIVVNGEERSVEGGATLRCYLEKAGVSPAGVVAEYNGEIVRSGCFAATELKDGDRVEFVRFVAGG
jgi:thiamine biosynthesis protein ThiS